MYAFPKLYVVIYLKSSKEDAIDLFMKVLLEITWRGLYNCAEWSPL